MKRIDLNVDIGEGFPFDRDLVQIATSANVCCGEHAGSRELARATLALCRERNVRVGAHPGYPDRASMGRAPSLSEDWPSIAVSVHEQVERTGEVAYIKPHGAFYNESTEAGSAFELLQKLLRRHEVPLMGLPGTMHEEAAGTAGVPFIREGFADRAYKADGLLVPRSEVGAVLHDLYEVRAQAVLLASRVDSICLHGDTEGCIELAYTVRAALEDAGYEVGR